jgi:two-component system cell cycle response regulator
MSVRCVQRWLTLAAALCLAAVFARNLGFQPPVPLWDEAYETVELLAAALCGLRAWQSAGSERAAWAVFGLGLLSFVAADVYYTLVLMDLEEMPYPSLADVGYLAFYPAAYVGLVLLLRARAPRVSSALWLDGLVCALACVAVGAALVLNVVAETDGSLATVVTNLAYPLADLTLLAFVAAVLLVAGRGAGSTWRLLGVAFALWAVADVVYLVQTARDTYEEFTVLDTSWPLCALLLGIAADRPAARLQTRDLRRGMLLLPAGATLLALAVLVADHYAHVNAVALWAATAAVCAAVARFALAFRENLRTLDASEVEATTDALTGLGNRRALLDDVTRRTAGASPERPGLLALFDLDGFKHYNDTFGHPAGDALLTRLGAALDAAVAGTGTAYRMGGDEFCVLAPVFDPQLLERSREALSAFGDGFGVRSSHGAVALGAEATDPAEALRLADQRMYAHKRSGRGSSGDTVQRVLLRVALEHDGELREHVDGVAATAEAVAHALNLDADEVLTVRRAAALHDIGKVAIPDEILHAPRALTAEEWQYMRQHTLIGERIIAAAPELGGVARIVRSSHERYDGRGYPDALAGDEIPLGARIVAVCDSYDAIVSHRAYRPGRTHEEALAELSRCAGTQFDPEVVAAFRVSQRQCAVSLS